MLAEKIHEATSYCILSRMEQCKVKMHAARSIFTDNMCYIFYYPFICALILNSVWLKPQGSLSVNTVKKIYPFLITKVSLNQHMCAQIVI